MKRFFQSVVLMFICAFMAGCAQRFYSYENSVSNSRPTAQITSGKALNKPSQKLIPFRVLNLGGRAKSPVPMSGSIAFSPDGAFLAAANYDSQGFAIYLLETKNWKRIKRFSLERYSPQSLRFSQDGKILVALGSQEFGTWGAWKNIIRAWNVSSGKSEYSIDDLIYVSEILGLMKDKIVLRVPEQGGRYPSVAVYDTKARKRIWEIDLPTTGQYAAFSESKKTLLICTDEHLLHLWRWQETKFIEEKPLIDNAEFIKQFPDTEISTPIFSSDGEYFGFISHKGQVVIFKTNSGRVVRNFQSRVTDTYDLAFSRDKQFVAALDYKGQVDLWNIQTQQYFQLDTMTKKQSVLYPELSFSPKNIIAVSSDVGKIILWRIK